MKKLFLVGAFWLGISLLAFSQIKVACVGNSITQGPGRDHPDSYPLLMQEVLGDDYEVKNFGVSGRTLLKMGDRPYWKESQFEEVQNFRPDILVIKLGTNDSKPQNWKHKTDFVEDYIELVHTLKASMPENGQVYICIPVPVFEDKWGINEPTMVKEIRPMLKKIAKVTDAKMINLHKPFKGKGALFPDGIHPNTAGNQLMAEKIAQKIQ